MTLSQEKKPSAIAGGFFVFIYFGSLTRGWVYGAVIAALVQVRVLQSGHSAP